MVIVNKRRNMKEKPKRNIVISIVATVVILVAVIAMVIVLKDRRNESGNNGGNDTGSSAQNNYSKIDTTVEYGDYDTMYTIAKSIQNGEMVGKVVRIDGVVSHPMNKYSIVEADGKGGTIGTEFEIDGVSEEAYPNDGSRVIITGEVVEKSPMYFIIKTSPEYVEIVETEGDDELDESGEEVIIEELEGAEELDF